MSEAPSDDEPRVTPELLALLDADPASAKRQFDELFQRLTRFLEWYRCPDPEGAAAEAIYRALKRVAEGADIAKTGFRGFAFGVAKLVARERARSARREQQLEPAAWDRRPSSQRDHERVDAMLMMEHVRRLLSPDEQQILLRYYSDDDHVAQARELGVSPGYLRVRVYRIREYLKRMLLRDPAQGRDGR